MDTPRAHPAVLFKYMSANRQSIFDDWLFRFTQPKALNDPFEMQPHISGYSTPKELRKLASQRLDEYARERYNAMVHERAGQAEIVPFDNFRARIEPHRNAQIEAACLRAPEYNAAMAEQINELLNKNVGVLSLCEHADNLLMWAHYGDSHRGFAIEFDTSAAFFHQAMPPAHVKASSEDARGFAEEYGRLRRISYQEERPSVVVTDMTFDTIMTKGKDWEYEGEWRMLMPLDYADVMAWPVIDWPIYLFAVPPSAVKTIILGCNANTDLIARALTLRANPETEHIGITKASVDAQNFLLNFEAIR
jgi:hypothetical protein